MKRVLPCLAELLQRGHHLVQRDLHVEIVAAVLGDQRIVELQQVDMVAAHALQALLGRLRDRLADIGASLRGQAHLGADHHVGI